MITTTAKQMLCLASLTYRDFADAGPPTSHDRRLQDDIADKLEHLPLLNDEWKLVWGPASYRAPFSLFDDVAAFVVQHNADPQRYVVAVRGTNPISAFDWLFGDLWVSGQVPWPFDASQQARISLSTALGLDVLLQLRAAPPAGDAGSAIWKRLKEPAAALADLVVNQVNDGALQPVRADLQQKLAGLASLRLGLQGRDPSARVEVLREQWKDSVREPLIKAAAQGLTALGGKPSLQALALLEKDAWIKARLHGGQDLLSFVRAAAHSGPLDLTFTGHSKGGALAPTLALWFDETRAGADGIEAWDTRGPSTIQCYHFAGPTAGNAAFAARSNQRIGARCFRIVNPLDVVPKAWVPKDVGGVGTLYGPPVQPIAGLDKLATTISDIVTAQNLTYSHLGEQLTTLPATLAVNKTDFVGQLIHQHLQAYLDAMDLGPLTVDTFFNPLH